MNALCTSLPPVLCFRRTFVVITQAEGNVAMREIRIGDLVLYHDPNAREQVPAMIVKPESQESAWLNVFTIHGSVALETPKPRSRG